MTSLLIELSELLEGAGRVVVAAEVPVGEPTIERQASFRGHEHLSPARLPLSVGNEAVEDIWIGLDRALRAAR